MAPIVGIDLGTTNSAVAWLDESGPQILVNALGHRLTPSVVGLADDGTLLVGAAAKELQVVKPERCAALFKRWMGSDHTVELAGRKYTAEELSSLVLKSLKADAEAHFREPVTRAVITVPAYFNDRQRKATIAAGQIAGLTVERILNEPTAAALAYGFRGGRESATILVFDLGGGTFDVSLVEQFEGSLEVRASAGETSLGGEDFTRTLAARILESQGQQFERAEMTAPAMVARVIQQCEKAKKTLSTAATATIRVPTAKGDMVAGTDVAVTREQLEQWIAPILSRIDAPIRRVMADARLTRDKIDDVILVGGATRMPVIVERVTDLFRKTPHSKLNPDEVVAMGAAVQAGLIGQNAAVEDLVVTDVSPFTLGVEISKEIGAVRTDGYFDPIIDRNSVIPVSRVKRYSTVHANQTEISIHVYQGENRRTKDNLKLAEFDVKGIPSGPPGQDVDIRFTYDLNGVLEVEATIVATGKKVSHIVAKHAKGLSQKDVARAVEAMAKLKVHPRDDAANHYVLARADRVFRELTAEKRHFLGVLIDGFEAALESRDPISINQHRETLESFLGNVDPDGDSGEAVPHDA